MSKKERKWLDYQCWSICFICLFVALAFISWATQGIHGINSVTGYLFFGMAMLVFLIWFKLSFR